MTAPSKTARTKLHLSHPVDPPPPPPGPPAPCSPVPSPALPAPISCSPPPVPPRPPAPSPVAYPTPLTPCTSSAPRARQPHSPARRLLLPADPRAELRRLTRHSGWATAGPSQASLGLRRVALLSEPRAGGAAVDVVPAYPCRPSATTVR